MKVTSVFFQMNSVEQNGANSRDCDAVDISSFSLTPPKPGFAQLQKEHALLQIAFRCSEEQNALAMKEHWEKIGRNLTLKLACFSGGNLILKVIVLPKTCPFQHTNPEKNKFTRCGQPIHFASIVTVKS